MFQQKGWQHLLAFLEVFRRQVLDTAVGSCCVLGCIIQQGSCWHVYVFYRFLNNRVSTGHVCVLFSLGFLSAALEGGCW